MPAQRPRASFEPIPPVLDLKRLVESTGNFQYVDRISCDMIDAQGMVAFEKLVTLHVIVGGRPLVIDGFEDRLDPWTFTPKWLRDNCGEEIQNARNITAKEDLPLTMGHYLKNMDILTNQFFDKENPGAWREKKRQRVYLKDIDCPKVWWDKLQEHLPACLTYLNDSTGVPGGPGAQPDLTSNVPGRRLGKGLARAGDLMSSLPPDMRAENLMCYIGHEGTYTPAHREMCASLGQNIMVEASNTVSDDGKAEKPGSSIWFMTESKDRHVVSEYWLSVLGHDIETENHFAQIVAWKKAPFTVYVVEQRPGDLILIPPLAPHQVWNRGTRTMKVAWNRTTVETLELAVNEALPRSRIVCRDEQYKNKAIIYYTLQKYASLLTQVYAQATRMPQHEMQQLINSQKIKHLRKDFKRLFVLYKQIMLSEMFSPEERDAPKAIEYLPFDSNVTCAYCRSNIFNRFLTCPSCKDLLGHHIEQEDGDPYDVCMDCYAMGRSCACLSGLKWAEQFRWKELAGKYEAWRNLIMQFDSQNENLHLSLLEERRRHGKKTLAEVCKDQLKRRPFKDVKKPAEEPKDDESEDEIVVNDDGQVKKIQKRKSKTWQKNNVPCHVCCHRHPVWKTAKCTTCDRSWCYGSLFRGWDKYPLEIMQDYDWQCPHCLGICFAGACKREGKMNSYEPKGTLLGHDTKKVADVRSVEALVDFSVSNLNWLKDDDPANRTESRRFQKARAEAEKNKSIDDADEDEVVDETQVAMEYTQIDDTSMIDPALGGARGAMRSGQETDHDESALSGGLRDLDEDDLAQRLQAANSSFPGLSVMTNGAAPGLNGYAPVNSAGYSGYAPPPANMYPQPDTDNGYQYPGYTEPGSQDLQPFRKRPASQDDEDEDGIAMQKGPKQKKPRLAAAGFRSSDLAGSAEGVMASKAKNEVQRQFEKEKERKALDRAKAEGRFIMLQAALKGKKRIVKLGIAGPRLGQILAQQASKNADVEHEPHNSTQLQPQEGNDDDLLLRSDIAPKKTWDHIAKEREQKVRDGFILSGGTKKALVPVEKDDSYGYRPRERLPNGKRVSRPMSSLSPTAGSKIDKRRSRPRQVEYEEVDVGSDGEDNDENDYDEDANASSAFIPINSAKGKRRSLPTYLQNRHADDVANMPDELPKPQRNKSRSTAKTVTADSSSQSVAASEQLQQETAAASSARASPKNAWKSQTAGKRPSMRPAPPERIEIEDDEEEEEADSDDAADTNADDDAALAEMINDAANGTFGVPSEAEEAAASSNPPVASSAFSTSAARQAQLKAQEAQRLIDEGNRLAKLQMLHLLDEHDDSGGAGVGSGARKAKPKSRPKKGPRVSFAQDVDRRMFDAERDDSDGSVDEVPARKKVRV